MTTVAEEPVEKSDDESITSEFRHRVTEIEDESEDEEIVPPPPAGPPPSVAKAKPVILEPSAKRKPDPAIVEPAPLRRKSEYRDTTSEIASELAAEETFEIEVVVCPNLLCGAHHLPGTMFCDRCQEPLDEEIPQWTNDDPIIAGETQEFFKGENAVIDQMVEAGHPSVDVVREGVYVANAYAIAKARNIIEVRAADEARARSRIEFVDKIPVTDTHVWSHKRWKWVPVREAQQEDYNKAQKAAIRWIERNLSQEQRLDRYGQQYRDPLYLRLLRDEEYLEQMVLRDEISQSPEKQHPDVKAKAVKAARQLGVLENILATYIVARAPGVRGEDGTCPIIEANADMLFMVVVFLVGMMCGILVMWLKGKFSKWLTPSRNVIIQSQTTYTSVRGNPNPRFLPLPHEAHGAHTD
jgi:hypothetical protein